MTTTESLPSTATITAPEVHEAHAAQFSGMPAIERLKREGWQRFDALPMPTRQNEQWRFSDTRSLKLEDYNLPETLEVQDATSLLSRTKFIEKPAGSLVFADNQLIEQTPISDELQKAGVIWEPLEVAFEKHPELIEKYFLAEAANLGSEKFSSLHQAYTQAGSVLYVPKGVIIDQTFVAYHFSTQGGTALFPHTLVIADDNSQVSLVDFYFSADGTSRSLSVGMGDIYAGAGAHVFRKAVQNWNDHMLAFQTDTVVAKRDADVKTISVNLGGQKARYENQVRIVEPGAHVKMYALTVAEEKQEFDQRTLQIHDAPNAVSDLLFKNALLDDARTIFSGLIKVSKDAQQTDAYQTNRNLLLSTTAEANSLPGLEIEANDVKCSHGATTGQLDKSELFYFLARGIPEKVAHELMVFGFFEEIIERIEDEELAGNLRTLVEAKLRGKDY